MMKGIINRETQFSSIIIIILYAIKYKPFMAIHYEQVVILK
jgi:hypothetical protein